MTSRGNVGFERDVTDPHDAEPLARVSPALPSRQPDVFASVADVRLNRASELSISPEDIPPVPEPSSAVSHMRVAVGVVAVISLVAALYLARAFFIPLLIGMLASYALHPVVDWLIVCRVPRALAAALVLALLAGGLSWVAFSLTDDVTAMIEKMPDAARKLRQTLSAARTRGPTALQNMQEAASELQGAATDAGAKSGARVTVARPSEPSAWVRDYAVAQSALLFAVASQTPIVLLLAYFLLASGEHFRPSSCSWWVRRLHAKKRR